MNPKILPPTKVKPFAYWRERKFDLGHAETFQALLKKLDCGAYTTGNYEKYTARVAHCGYQAIYLLPISSVNSG